MLPECPWMTWIAYSKEDEILLLEEIKNVINCKKKSPKQEAFNLEEALYSYLYDLEWFRTTAYWDVKRYSIWYGTPSYKWEVITKQEAIRRKIEHTQPIIELVDRDCYNNNQKIAIISYIYNTWGYQMNLRSHIKNCKHKAILNVMNTWGWSADLDWNWKIEWKERYVLAKRRNIEIQKFKG